MPSAQGVRAGAAYVELYTKDNRLLRGLARASKRLEAFGASVRAIGLRIAAAGTAMLAPLLGAAKLFASAGDQLDKMREQTGFSAEALSELGFAAEQSGASIDHLGRALAAMARFSVMVERGVKTAVDLLDMLGVSAEQFKQAGPEERFKLLAEAISKIEDPTLRAGIALNVFGRSARELLPLLKGGRASIEALQDEAHRLGITLTDEDATAAAALNDALNRLKRQLKAIVVQVGAALAPVLTEMQARIASVITSTIKWIKENKTLVVTILKIAAAVIAAGIGLIILGTLISSTGAVISGLVATIGVVGTAITALGKMIMMLLTPIGMVTLAVTALAGTLLYATQLGGKTLTWLGERFQVLKNDAIAAWQGIGDALAAGDIALAAKILWLTLKMEWKKGVHFLNEQWIAAKKFFFSLWTDAVYAVARVFIDAWATLETAWSETVGFLADAWSTFTNFLSKTWHRTIGFIKKAWVRLKSLFVWSIDVDAEVAKINEEVSDAIQEADQKMVDDISRRERERRTRREQIEQERAGAQAVLTEMQTEEDARRQRQFADDLATTEGELADARREWQEAIAEAAKKRKEVEASEPERMKELQDSLSFSASAVSEEQQKVEVKGTFSALAARGLGAESLAERTARGVEQIVVNTKELVDQAKQGKLVFT